MELSQKYMIQVLSLTMSSSEIGPMLRIRILILTLVALPEAEKRAKRESVKSSGKIGNIFRHAQAKKQCGTTIESDP